MKIAISSTGETLQSEMDPRFGRCKNFIIVDSTNLSFISETNKAQFEGHGAGIQAAQFLINNEVEAVISGSVGPNAFQVLSVAKIEMYACSGNILDAIKKYNEGLLSQITQPSKFGHQSGMGQGRGGGSRRSRNM